MDDHCYEFARAAQRRGVLYARYAHFALNSAFFAVSGVGSALYIDNPRIKMVAILLNAIGTLASTLVAMRSGEAIDRLEKDVPDLKRIPAPGQKKVAPPFNIK